MKKFELNGLGKEWIFLGESEEDCTRQLIESVVGANNVEEYQRYCKDVGVSEEINWKQLEIEDIEAEQT